MQRTRPAPIPFDLSPLPEGFRKQVERHYRKGWQEGVLNLAFAVGEAWRKSTAEQRKAVEAGVNALFRTALVDEGASFSIGVIGTLYIDLDMEFVTPLAERDKIDSRAVLQGVRQAGGIRVNTYIEAFVNDAFDAEDRKKFGLTARPWVRRDPPAST